MKRAYLRFRVMLMTFALGLASVFLFNGFLNKTHENFLTLSETKSSDVLVVFPRERKSMFGEKRFNETWRACKPGYAQGYITNDGMELTEGNNCEKSEGIDERIIQKNNERVISEIERKDKISGQIYQIGIGQKRDPSNGERNYKKSYKIYQIRTGHCIESPSIELGLELENFLKTNR